MDFWFSLFSIEIGLLLAAVLLYYVLYYPFDYWKKKGVPYLKPKYPIIGTTTSLFDPIQEMAMNWYKSFPDHKFFGTFTLWRPTLIIKDPELIENVLIKDFSHFYNRNNVVDIETNELSKHLVNYNDEKWKALRNKLTPTFSSGKLKGMQPQLVNCAESLVKYLSRFDKKDEFDLKDLCGRFSMDVVASCAFGLDLDIMNHPDSEFYEIGKNTFAPNYFIRLFFMLQSFLAPLYKKLRMGLISRKLTSFFVDAVDQTLEYREKNNITRPDFLHLLNEQRKKDAELVRNGQLNPHDPAVFDHDSLVSNAFVFFAAGYETTATTLSYLFYELALNPDIQEKVYDEVVTILNKHNGEFTYEALAEMNYLDQVVSETLRMHPPGTALERKVTKDYPIPGSNVVVPAGIGVFIPVYGLHYDAKYFPQPEKFNPERFDPDKNTISKGTYLPFGGGPRICIAARFARTEVKVCAAMVLKNFKVLPCSKTNIPLIHDERSFLLIPKNGMWLSIDKRQTAQG